MNFIEAHMIVHDYGGALAKGTNRNALIFRPNSYLKNTKDEIIDAYKIFYAHMIFFNTRTQEEYEQYKNRKKLDEANQLQQQYMDAISASFSKGYYRNDEIEKFFSDAQSIALNMKPRISNLDLNDEHDFEEYFDTINAYAAIIYPIANIDLQSNDIDYFFPF